MDFRSIISGTGQPQITAEPLENYKVKIPKWEEQNKLVAIFKSIDKNISLYQADVEYERQKKKALMQLLLTGIVRVDA